MAIGFGSMLWNRQIALKLFLFLFPFISISPVLVNDKNPYNYMAIPLFLLSGIIIGGMLIRFIKPDDSSSTKKSLDREFFLYYMFLFILFISAIFVFLRWSNITLDSLTAFFRDTPVSPPVPDLIHNDSSIMNEQRVSFASIFPVVSLFIYFISPFVFFLIKKTNLAREKVFVWLSYGFFISVLMAIFQKLFNYSPISDRLGKEVQQFNGGCSDFNAFGFFCGVMFLWSTCEIKNKNKLGYVVFIAALIGGLLSGSRTVYIFIVIGFINLGLKIIKRGKKQKKRVATIVVGVLLLAVIFSSGPISKRLTEGFSQGDDLFEKIDAITNGRLWMTMFSIKTCRDHLISGVGTGNFTFYLAYKNYLPFIKQNKRYLYDLTLNHYLLIFTEIGVLGFVYFTAFLVLCLLRSSRKILMGAILFGALVNNFFWFPEAFLLFWVIVALYNTDVSKIKGKKSISLKSKGLMASIVGVIFLISNIFVFNNLHPKNLAHKTGTPYNYGFWYAEKDSTNERFCWTKSRSGVYLFLNNQGESPAIRLSCGAPLEYFKGKKQKVNIYWKGTLYKEITFTKNEDRSFKIKSRPRDQGFMEIHVSPTFNLKKMKISPESRDLGVKFYTN
jgi:hypothetical protein